MSEQIILSIITIVSSVISSFVGWLVGRRKNNADARSIDTEVTNKIRDHYRMSFDDVNRQLEQYIVKLDKCTSDKLGQREAIMEFQQMYYDVMGKVDLTEENKDYLLRKIESINKKIEGMSD